MAELPCAECFLGSGNGRVLHMFDEREREKQKAVWSSYGDHAPVIDRPLPVRTFAVHLVPWGDGDARGESWQWLEESN